MKNGPLRKKNGPLRIKNGPLRIKNGPLRKNHEMRHFVLFPEYIIPWTTKVNQGGINLTFIDIDVVGRAESNCRPLPTVKLI